MKRYIQKIINSSSATKLLILIFFLIAVVLFASSSFYIQYKSDQKSEAIAVAGTSEDSISAKSQLSRVTDRKVSDTKSSNSASASGSTRPSTAEPSLPATKVACKEQVLKYTTIQKNADWLRSGETRIEKGKNGYSKTCEGRVMAVEQPVAEIVYIGTKLAPKLLSPVGEVLEDTNDLLNSALGI